LLRLNDLSLHEREEIRHNLVNLNDFFHVINWIQLAKFVFVGGSYENGLERLGIMKGGAISL
jgi:hypothetical protein